MNALHEALMAHTATPDLISKASLRKHYEAGWMNARIKTIENNGNTVDIVLAAVLNMESRTRSKIITPDQYNTLYGIATAAQSNLSLIYSYDTRCQVLHARMVEAHRSRTTNPYVSPF